MTEGMLDHTGGEKLRKTLNSCINLYQLKTDPSFHAQELFSFSYSLFIQSFGHEHFHNDV